MFVSALRGRIGARCCQDRSGRESGVKEKGEERREIGRTHGGHSSFVIVNG